MGWVLAAVAVAVVLWFALGSRRLGKFWSRRHLIEVAEGLRRIRGEMAEEAGGKRSPSALRNAPPPVIRTSEGLNVAWTARRTEAGYEHHLSQSSNENTWAANGVILGFVLGRLGIPWDSVDVFKSQNGVIHATFHLDVDAHGALCERSIPDPPAGGDRELVSDLATEAARRGHPRLFTVESGRA